MFGKPPWKLLLFCALAAAVLLPAILEGGLGSAQEPTPTVTPSATPTATWTITPTPTATPTPANTPTPWAFIDKNISNGDGPCDIIDDQTVEYVGDSHQLAVCVDNMPAPVSAFRLVVSYDGTLDGCTEVECTDGLCLDDNPDANVGTTTWGGGLGDGWDCDIEGEPVCHQVLPTGDALDTIPLEGGLATIWCYGEGGTLTSGALAVLDLSVLGAGTDNVEIDSLVVYDDAGAPIAQCGQMVSPGITDAIFPMPCQGATDIKQSAPPTTVVSIGSGSVASGGQVTVPLEALGVPSPGLGAFVIDISYDPSVVDPVGCIANPEGDLDLGFCNFDFERNDVNPDTIRVGGFRASEGATGDLSLADITFQGVGSSGSESPLALGVDEFADTSVQPIPVTTEDGTITIGVQGDANGDGKVSMVDAMLIAQCVVGLIDCGSIDQTMADVNCSGDVTMVDAMLVAQYVVGLIDEFPCPLMIGLLLPFTGDLAGFGPPLQNAAGLAVKHINQAGGVLGRPMEIIWADSGTSAAMAMSNASWLIDEGVSAIVGPLASNVTLPVAEGVTVPRGMLQISPASTSPALSTLEDDDLLFRTALSDAAQGKVLAGLAQEKGYATASTLYLNNAYGQGLSDVFAAEFGALGGSVLATVPHEDWQSTYLPELETATASDPDVLAAISYPSQATVYLDEAIGSGLICEFLFVEGTKSQEMIDELAAEHGLGCLSGMCGTAGGQVESAAGDAFDAAYEAEYGEPPPVPFARETYDAVILIALAAEAAGSTDPLDIRDALRSIANPGGEVVGLGALGIGNAFDLIRLGVDVDYEGTSGAVDFDGNGDVISGAIEVWCIDEYGQIVSVRQEEVVLD